jgi:hypothetical protein
MNKKIDFTIRLLDKTIYFEVSKMDEKYRNIDYLGTLLYTSSNGIEIWSILHPELSCTLDFVFVRGRDNDKDTTTVQIQLDSVEEAEVYYNRIIEALEGWNEHICTI